MHASTLDSLASEVLAVAGLLLRQLLTGLALTVTAFVAGRTLLGWLGVAAREGRGARDAGERPEAAGPGLGPGPAPGPAADRGARPWLGVGGAVETAALATALGLVVVAHTGLLLGLAGLLKPWPILLALLCIHLASLPAWRSRLRWPRGPGGPRGLRGPCGLPWRRGRPGRYELRGLRGPSGRAGRLGGRAEGGGGEAAVRRRPPCCRRRS
jgi:hypothetical protein